VALLDELPSENLAGGYAMRAHVLRSLLIAVVLASGLCPSPASAGENTWTALGLYGSLIHDVVVDPANPNLVYAAGTAGVHRSTDGGLTWSTSLGTATNALALDPNSPGVLFLAKMEPEGGIYKSTDAGESWTRFRVVEVEGEDLHLCPLAVAVSPVDSSLVLAGNYDAGLDSGCLPAGVYRSLDGGATWNHVGQYPGRIEDVAFSPSAPHVAYATHEHMGLLRSMDAGETWERALGGFASVPWIRSLRIDPTDSQAVYIGAPLLGLYRTGDGGASWHPIGDGLTSTDIAAVIVDPADQQVLYAAACDGSVGSGPLGVFRSSDNNGQSWTPMSDGLGGRGVWSLAADASGNTLYAGTRSGIYKYTIASRPQAVGFTINAGALYTNSVNVALALEGPSGTTEMIVSNDGGFADAAWEPYAGARPWTISSLGSYVMPRTVYVQFKVNGQVSGLYTDDIILDTTPPTGTVEVVRQADGAEATSSDPPEGLGASAEPDGETMFVPLLMRNHRPGFRRIEVMLNATDDLSGVEDVMLSNSSSFAGAKWESYAPLRYWWAPDLPAYTVYAKFRDRAGNESSVSRDLYP